MNSISLLLFFSVVTTGTLLTRFENWVNNFKISFENEEHYASIFNKWTNNNKFIEEINSRNLSYQLGHNQFSGMDETDFMKYLGLSRVLMMNSDFTEHSTKRRVFGVKTLELVNWVSAGAVSPVKNQGQCGSCWSFSSTGALEGAYFNKYGKLISFSEQQLVDCDNFRNGGKDMGCKGGLMDNAFAWIGGNGGLCSESDYPYVSGETAKNGVCQTSCSLVKNSAIKEFVDIIKSSDEEMMDAISQQPVSIAIQADQREFQLYKSGVFTGTCGTNLDHGVLLVGYGELDGLDYYLVKNSWGTSWGDAGYIKLGRGDKYNNGDGQCGLLLQGSYPVL
jgi:C1A family cysteine protease